MKDESYKSKVLDLITRSGVDGLSYNELLNLLVGENNSLLVYTLKCLLNSNITFRCKLTIIHPYYRHFNMSVIQNTYGLKTKQECIEHAKGRLKIDDSVDQGKILKQLLLLDSNGTTAKEMACTLNLNVTSVSTALISFVFFNYAYRVKENNVYRYFYNKERK
jgi:hypothetical protein